MEANNSKENKQGIANFAAVKTAIANGEEERLKELLDGQSMQELEKSYLLELADLSNNPTILKLLEDVPVKTFR